MGPIGLIGPFFRPIVLVGGILLAGGRGKSDGLALLILTALWAAGLRLVSAVIFIGIGENPFLVIKIEGQPGQTHIGIIRILGGRGGRRTGLAQGCCRAARYRDRFARRGCGRL